MARRSWSTSGLRLRSEATRRTAASTGAAAATSGLVPIFGTADNSCSLKGASAAPPRSLPTPAGRGRIRVASVVSRFGEGIVAHAYPRIAQHSISSPGISPVTWIAIAADRANAAK